MDSAQPASPVSTITEPSLADVQKRCQRGKKTIEADLELLRATDDLKPYGAPSRQKPKAWEKVADKISKPELKRTSKYCMDRVRELLKDYRVDKNKRPPTGDEQQPPLTEEEILLENVDAAVEISKSTSDAQKEKASGENLLAKQLEEDALKSMSAKSRHVRKEDDDWYDEHLNQQNGKDGGDDPMVPSTSRLKFISPRKRNSPWKNSSPRSFKRQNRDNLFRDKFAKDAEQRKLELQDKQSEREHQKEMLDKKLQHEKDEKEKDRELERVKDEQAASIRRAEVGLQQQTSDLLRQLVVSLIKKD